MKVQKPEKIATKNIKEELNDILNDIPANENV